MLSVARERTHRPPDCKPGLLHCALSSGALAGMTLLPRFEGDGSNDLAGGPPGGQQQQQQQQGAFLEAAAPLARLAGNEIDPNAVSPWGLCGPNLQFGTPSCCYHPLTGAPYLRPGPRIPEYPLNAWVTGFLLVRGGGGFGLRLPPRSRSAAVRA